MTLPSSSTSGRVQAVTSKAQPRGTTLSPKWCPDSQERQAANAGIECINCAVCYSACDVVSWRPEYLGPAALNRAWTLVNDVRHAARDAVMDTVSEQGGCLTCHTHGSCTEYCPVEISPTAAIAGLKREAFRRFLRGSRK